MIIEQHSKFLTEFIQISYSLHFLTNAYPSVAWNIEQAKNTFSTLDLIAHLPFEIRIKINEFNT